MSGLFYARYLPSTWCFCPETAALPSTPCVCLAWHTLPFPWRICPVWAAYFSPWCVCLVWAANHTFSIVRLSCVSSTARPKRGVQIRAISSIQAGYRVRLSNFEPIRFPNGCRQAKSAQGTLNHKVFIHAFMRGDEGDGSEKRQPSDPLRKVQVG